MPFGLSLSHRVFTKVAEATLVPLREQGTRILNYLDDWFILTQSQDQLWKHRFLVLSHLSQLGLSDQLGKEQTLHDAEHNCSRYGVGFCRTDSMPHAGTCMIEIQEQDGGPTEIVSEAPGAYGSCSGSHCCQLLPRGR